jgi:hypothetical protein
MGRAVEDHWHILTVLVKERFNMDMIKYEEEKEGRRERKLQGLFICFFHPSQSQAAAFEIFIHAFFFTIPASVEKVALKGSDKKRKKLTLFVFLLLSLDLTQHGGQFTFKQSKATCEESGQGRTSSGTRRI